MFVGSDRDNESGSGRALMLVPAAVLVLVILGAIVVDSAIVFLAHRELNNRAAAAANDAAAVALQEAAYYDGARVCLDPAVVGEVVDAAFSRDRLPSAVRSAEASAVVAGRTVTVSVRAEVPLVFAPAVPGVDRTASVTTRVAVTARGAAGGAPVDIADCFF
jgi:hypothetical protein